MEVRKESGSSSYRGVFGILPTPFQENGQLDEDSLKNIVDFCIEAGAHGIATPVNASEFTSLTDEERIRIVKIVTGRAAGRIPVIAGVAGCSAEHAAYLTEKAVAAGADSLMAMPPYIRKCTQEEIIDYYLAIDAVSGGLPIWIQNNMPPVGTVMQPALMDDIILRAKNICYIKEECNPSGHFMTEMFELKNMKLRGIFGGMAAKYIMDEFARGAAGTMPACEVCDAHVKLWEKLEEKNEPGARAIFNQMLPLLNMECIYGSVVYKEVLYRRGIIRTPVLRKCGNFPLDDFDRKELTQILEDMKPLFKI